ncbi:golgin candidate 5 [Selaginella moellendorffii]|uniref:golgin candidate 5 n=1 Tax=Selaginella moellendorffii TaxID=88036 RepID=UPI000D1C36EE|nr:golgin candidate 5 [Selaginella moellendorffii]|eukprot:XP_024519580.1 golgin candidate 5 [Selaginella moellendorffii]
MAWWNLSSDIAGAVTKISEGVKTIERNFDSALGLEGSAGSNKAEEVTPPAPAPDPELPRSPRTNDALDPGESEIVQTQDAAAAAAAAEEEEDDKQPSSEAQLTHEEEVLDEAHQISRLIEEKEQLRRSLEEASKKRSSQVELEALKQELGAAERKVYALTKERDMLRREVNRKSDSTALLKEKDDIIKQVMAEGEELSKKQASQEAAIRKLRSQVRELEEEKQRLHSKLQVEEAKVESMRKDKAATEKALQETLDKGHADLAAQREFYTKMVNEARESEARAESRASSQAKADLDQRLHQAAQRESALVQSLEELRQGLSRAEQVAAYREDVLRKDIESLERRCQDAETRYDDLVARVPESTRPLLRQIEAMQESSAMRAEAWSGAERALNSRLQEADAKAAAATERERATNERLSQTLSRLAVMEAQVSCVKAELSQVTRSLEAERARASETRQELLAALESAASHEGRAKVLHEELIDVKEKYAQVLGQERSRRLALEQELSREREMRGEAEERVQRVADDKMNSRAAASGTQQWRLPSLTSVNGMEEGHFLQASLDSYKAMVAEPPPPSPPPVSKGNVSAEQFESVMRHKEGELSSYATRLAELESTRAALAEELVRSTSECEKLRSEASTLRGLRAELEALRRRHASALELMGERDEQVEELRADLADVKQMYREQIDMLVSQMGLYPRSERALVV